VRCGLKRRIAKFLESKRDKERSGFFFYRSINRMHSYSEKGNIVKSWVENVGMVERLGDDENFSDGFCKARLVRWFMSLFDFSKLYPKISVMEFVLRVYFDDLPTGWVSTAFESNVVKICLSCNVLKYWTGLIFCIEGSWKWQEHVFKVLFLFSQVLVILTTFDLFWVKCGQNLFFHNALKYWTGLIFFMKWYQRIMEMNENKFSKSNFFFSQVKYL
jgi:hypothetical protein